MRKTKGYMVLTEPFVFDEETQLRIDIGAGKIVNYDKIMYAVGFPNMHVARGNIVVENKERAFFICKTRLDACAVFNECKICGVKFCGELHKPIKVTYLADSNGEMNSFIDCCIHEKDLMYL